MFIFCTFGPTPEGYQLSYPFIVFKLCIAISTGPAAYVGKDMHKAKIRSYLRSGLSSLDKSEYPMY